MSTLSQAPAMALLLNSVSKPVKQVLLFLLFTQGTQNERRSLLVAHLGAAEHLAQAHRDSKRQRMGNLSVWVLTSAH